MNGSTQANAMQRSQKKNETKAKNEKFQKTTGNYFQLKKKMVILTSYFNVADVLVILVVVIVIRPRHRYCTEAVKFMQKFTRKIK